MSILKPLFTAFLFGLLLPQPAAAAATAHSSAYDVVVVGGGAGGTCAALQAARMGCSVLLAEPTAWLGGMLTAAGVSATDGCYRLPGGLWGDFRDALAAHYGSLRALQTGWVSNVMFEPAVGERILEQWTARQPLLRVSKQTQLKRLRRLPHGWLLTLRTPQGRRQVMASYLIDATELGDAGYMAGLCFETSRVAQDVTYVATVQQSAAARLLPRPRNYRASEFRNCCINPLNDSTTLQKLWPAHMMLSYGHLQHGKYMLNWPIWGNDFYLDYRKLTPRRVARAIRKMKRKTLRYVYFLQHELGFRDLELATEYPSADRLPLIPYYRDSRRFRGLVRMDIEDIVNPSRNRLYQTSIAVGDYPVDQHHYAYDAAWAARQSYPSIPSYGIPAGVVVSSDDDRLLLAEKCISVSETVNGTTRLQPVVMQLGQAAGAIAALAVRQHVRPHEVSVRQVQTALLEAGGYLLPLLDKDRHDPCFKPLQRIAVTGILQPRGRSIDWSNEMWLHTDSAVNRRTLSGLARFYPAAHIDTTGTTVVSQQQLHAAIRQIARTEGITITDEQYQKVYSDFGLGTYRPSAPALRLHLAVLADRLLHPFERRDVNWQGNPK
ncbi:FAD-dependent oxidoreductase [Prevotella sp. kh1p2]|uniref:FAD-dependent oxidoreductase n=1 Tax=Prevotella sp. kh1p2 TaxID=1761883 RepID=UPI0008AE6BC4|nr:FAD-dependent oxidoreductase [Prevotella sp. kh1p2]SET20739.1 FAD dependent oxidoreductase [Prevotella sp. kh1p2]